MKRQKILIFCSIVLGFCLMIFPVSASLNALRPEWVCLLVIYWVIFLPDEVNVGVAWLIGLLQDALVGSVWGAHALALSVVAYVSYLSYLRMRSYSIWQQAMWVFILVGMHQMLVNWVHGLAGYEASLRQWLLPALLSCLFWPLLGVLMHRVRMRYRAY